MATKPPSAAKPTPAQLAAAALGRLGGKANTPAQRKARQQNAQFAGRPRRVCVECGAPVVGGHVDRDLDVSCGAHGWRWQQGSKPREDAPLVRLALTPEDAKLIVDTIRVPSIVSAFRAALTRTSRNHRKP